MDRISGAGHVARMFVAEDAGQNRPPTEITAQWLNNVQEEIMAVIEGQGLAPDVVTMNQLATAIKMIFQKSTPNSVAASGTVNAITANFDPAITALTNHLRLTVRASGANTTTTPTFTPASATIAAKTIVKGHNQPLVAGDISGAGFRADLQYDLTLDKWVLLNPAMGVSASGASGADLQAQTYTAFTTAGVSGTFTLTPTPAITAYAANQRFRIKFHVAGTGTDTINISAKGAKNIKQYDSTGAKVAPVIAANALFDIEYDGVDFVILDPLPLQRQIQPITATVAANALTLGLSSTTLDFRAPALTTGAVNTRSVAAALSLVVPSGATLGTVSGRSERLVLLAIDNAGTVELAVANLAGGVNLDETTLISTTAISAAASSASVIYSTTARANVPFRVVGFVGITQAAAGTWATAPTVIQGAGGNAMMSMQSIGYGQNWQDVTASRSLSTTYYNTTGSPIAVFIVTGSNGTTVTINGIALITTSVVNSLYYPWSFIVPPGGSYSVASGNSVNKWLELR